jgi:sulfite exporter TauE/SafE/copper chaperone CopZ
MSTIKKTFLIDGMTCVSCENRIRQKLMKTPGIKTAEVSYSKGLAIVTFQPELIRPEEIEQTIETLDYRIRRPERKAEQKYDFTNLIGIAIIILAIYMLAKRFGLFEFFYNFPLAKEGMSYGMLFIIGLLTSVHCLAMCGGICLTQCIGRQDESSAAGKYAAIRPAILYNLGRVISYTVIGAIVGALGSVVSLSGNFKGMLQIIAGIFMVIMALNMMNVFPALRKLTPRMPRIFAGKIHALKGSRSPFYIGILNGLMPCGPLQAMQIYALSTGSLIRGAFSMFLFSIGTLPLMLAFGVLSSLLSKKFTHKMMTAGAILLLIMGIFLFNSGAALSGLSLSSGMGSRYETEAPRSDKVAVIKDGVQTVTTSLASGRYESITVQKGIPVRWIIKADKSNINGCNNSIIIPKLGITHDFVPGDNVIEFTPTESGMIPYSCWMGMIRSKIIVTDGQN